MHEKPGLRVELVLLRPIDALSGALGCSDMIGTRIFHLFSVFRIRNGTWTLSDYLLDVFPSIVR